MSWVLLVTMAILLAAIVLIEVRAIREGDERRRHAPGYALTLIGLVAIAIGIAEAISNHGPTALVLAGAGLVTVALGATRHDLVVAQH
jgi:hypothetical protein